MDARVLPTKGELVKSSSEVLLVSVICDSILHATYASTFPFLRHTEKDEPAENHTPSASLRVLRKFLDVDELLTCSLQIFRHKVSGPSKILGCESRLGRRFSFF